MAARIDWSTWLGPAFIALAGAMLGVLAGIDPRLAIVAALGFGFVLIVLTDLAAGIAVFAFLSFVEVLTIGNDTVSVTKLAGLLLAASWFALMTTRPRSELDFFSVHPYITVALGCFIGWVLISTSWAVGTGETLGSAGRYALDALLFVIIFTAIRTPKQLGWVMLAFVLGAAVAAFRGIIAPTGEEAAGRLGTDILDPSQLSAVLVSGVALSLGVIVLFRNSPLLRVGALTIAVFAVVAISLTASRGGVVALGIAMIAAIVLGGRWRIQITVLVALFGAMTYLYFATVAPTDIRERIISPNVGQEKIEEGRTTLWQVAWRAFEANPVKGVGSGNFSLVSRNYLLEPGVLARTDEIVGDNPKVVHNSYLEVAAELGVVGFVLFSLIVLFSLGSTLRASRLFRLIGDRRMQAVALCIAVALIGDLGALFFISDQYSKQLWILMGLGPVVLSIARTAKERHDSGLPAEPLGV
jgi:putative inorganic carbon (HCO3(-)) transporter